MVGSSCAPASTGARFRAGLSANARSAATTTPSYRNLWSRPLRKTSVWRLARCAVGRIGTVEPHAAGARAQSKQQIEPMTTRSLSCFGVFDTSLVRATLFRSDVFRLVFHRLRAADGLPDWVDEGNFLAARLNAER